MFMSPVMVFYINWERFNEWYFRLNIWGQLLIYIYCICHHSLFKSLVCFWWKPKKRELWNQIRQFCISRKYEFNFLYFLWPCITRTASLLSSPKCSVITGLELPLIMFTNCKQGGLRVMIFYSQSLQKRNLESDYFTLRNWTLNLQT